MQFIEADTLREWLENGRPVTVLDVRAPEDHEEWSIPESLHVNAYERLKAGEPDALAGVTLPKDRPVVTICNAGKVSQVAAEQLRQRGIDAFPLAGGMKSWSLAWNTAELVLDNTTVVQVRRTGKGCLSYLIGSRSEALVIDASLDPAVYLRLADQHGWRIRYVLDKPMHVTMAVYDVLGRELETLVNERLNAGMYEVDWDGSKFASGVYYYKLSIVNRESSIDFQETRKMVLMK